MGTRNVRDREGQAAIKAIVSELPKNHPARAAYEAGADAMRLMSLVDREDLADKLNQTWLEWYSRRLHQQRSAGAE